jgi:hypothetical protein
VSTFPCSSIEDVTNISSLIEEKAIADELGGGRENAKHSEQVHPKRLVQEDDILLNVLQSSSNRYSKFSNNY